mgnify:CR=1 FL=1|tara:strand:+ start:77 stop:1327 length:1251 start_codon:yes stop_codon:yes gene_type:complete
MSLTVNRVEYFDKDTGELRDVSYRNMTPQEIHALAINKGPTGSEAYMKEIVKLTKEVAEGQARTNVVLNSPKNALGRLLSNPYDKNLDSTIDALMQTKALQVAALTGDAVAQQKLEGIVQGGGTPPSDQGEGAGAPPPSGGGAGTPPASGGGGTTKTLTTANDKKQPMSASWLDAFGKTGGTNMDWEQWKNFDSGIIPTISGQPSGVVTPVGPWDTGGLFDPRTMTTPGQYAGLLSTANLANIAPTFQRPFQDYLDRAELSYGLMDPLRSATQGAGGFANYLTANYAPASAQDMWGQVQNIYDNFANFDPVAQAQIAQQYGIGADDLVDTTARDRRGRLAAQLMSYNVNPLLRNTYSNIMNRRFAQASLENQMYRDNPLAWALQQQTGYVAPVLQQTMPTFDPLGNQIGSAGAVTQ